MAQFNTCLNMFLTLQLPNCYATHYPIFLKTKGHPLRTAFLLYKIVNYAFSDFAD
jgi:hypothetical protein